MCYLQRHFFLINTHKDAYNITMLGQKYYFTFKLAWYSNSPSPSLRIASSSTYSIFLQQKLNIIVHSVSLQLTRKYEMDLCVGSCARLYRRSRQRGFLLTWSWYIKQGKNIGWKLEKNWIVFIQSSLIIYLDSMVYFSPQL